MKPGYLTLPTIWRGCTWPSVLLQWLDQDGRPINLSGWFPRAFTRHFDLNARIVDAVNGITAVGLNKVATSELAQGVEDWDWVWLQRGATGATLPPMLKGKVIVRHPVTNPEALIVVRIGGGSQYCTIRSPGPHFSLLGRYDLYVNSDIADQLTQMRLNGQNQIGLFAWYVSGLRWPDPSKPPTPPGYFYPSRPWVYLHALIPYHGDKPEDNPYPFPPTPDKVIDNATLSPQSKQNLIDLLALLNELGYEELHVRPAMQGEAGLPNTDPVPPNDNWADATLLTGGVGGFVTIPGTTVGASLEQRLRQWVFSSSLVMADPGSGQFRLNNAQMSSATQMVLSQNTSLGFTQHDILVSLHAGDRIRLQDVTNKKTRIAYQLTGDPVNNTTYFQIPIVKVPDSSAGGTPADSDLITFVFVVDQKVNGAETEPDGGGEATVWYKINGNNHWWSFQVSRPFRAVIEAFHGPGVYHLTSDGISNGSLHPPQPCIFYAATGTTYYIRVGISNVRIPFEDDPEGIPNVPDYFTLAYQQDAGLNEPPVPDYPVLPVLPDGWVEENKESQYVENSAFIRNLTTLVEANKGALKVNYDLHSEGASRRLLYSHTHRYFLARLWRDWSTQFGVFTSCLASAQPKGYGIRFLIDLLKASQLPLPGFYAIDSYGSEIEGLTRVHNTLIKEGPEEKRKKIYIFETYYNDPQVAKDLRAVIRSTGLNFGGIHQFPVVRGQKSFPFPDGFPREFSSYINL